MGGGREKKAGEEGSLVWAGKGLRDVRKGLMRLIWTSPCGKATHRYPQLAPQAHMMLSEGCTLPNNGSSDLHEAPPVQYIAGVLQALKAAQRGTRREGIAHPLLQGVLVWMEVWSGTWEVSKGKKPSNMSTPSTTASWRTGTSAETLSNLTVDHRWRVRAFCLEHSVFEIPLTILTRPSLWIGLPMWTTGWGFSGYPKKIHLGTVRY